MEGDGTEERGGTTGRVVSNPSVAETSVPSGPDTTQ